MNKTCLRSPKSNKNSEICNSVTLPGLRFHFDWHIKSVPPFYYSLDTRLTYQKIHCLTVLSCHLNNSSLFSTSLLLVGPFMLCSVIWRAEDDFSSLLNNIHYVLTSRYIHRFWRSSTCCVNDSFCFSATSFSAFACSILWSNWLACQIASQSQQSLILKWQRHRLKSV